MRSVLALSALAAFASLASAQINLDDINLDDLPDDVKDLVPSGVLENLPSELPSEIPSEIGTLLPSELQAVPSPTATGNADDNNTLPGLVDQLPRCAVGCLDTAAQEINCGVTDFSCLCNNAAALGENMISCILTSSGCGISDATDAGRVAPEICNRVNNNPNPEELASASRMVENAVETGTSDNNDDDSGAAAISVSVALFGAAFLVALNL